MATLSECRHAIESLVYKGQQSEISKNISSDQMSFIVFIEPIDDDHS